MIEEVRSQTQDLIREACRSEDPVLIEAPPASGKTYNRYFPTGLRAVAKT